MAIRIACIVEGHAEVESVPILVRRLALELEPSVSVILPRPIRLTKGKLLKPEELQRAVGLAALNVEGDGGILVVLDSDEDCPAKVGPELLQRLRASRSDLPSAVVLAKREFEAWFLASAESLRGRRGLPQDLSSPDRCEDISGAKEWLTNRMSGSSYASTVDQSALASSMDLKLARRADSFDKFVRDVNQLIRTLSSRL